MELNDGVVSLIVPCWNGEKTIARCLDSILAQTYRKIELIVVNDGSEDGTHQIIISKEPALKKALWDFQYVVQDNAGVGAAVNAALKKFTGEFLTLLDADDTIMPESIARKATWLQEHPDYAVVRSNGFYVRAGRPGAARWLFYEKEDEPQSTDLFADLISGKAKNWAGSYMIRASVWLARCGNREIFPSRNGQNLQLLLPAAYQTKAGFLAEPLMNYMLRQDSLSHFSDDVSGEKALAASAGYQEIYETVIRSVCGREEIPKILRKIRATFCRSRMRIAISVRNQSLLWENYKELKEQERATLDDRIDYYGLRAPAVSYFLRGIRKTRTALRRLMRNDVR